MDFFQTIFSSTSAAILGILLLGLTVFVHELGHFLAARRRGLHVERFSIGFGPALYKWTGKDGVEYRIAWIPFGGYVLLPQLAEMPAIEGESKAGAEKLPPLSWSSKVIVAVAGPLFNVVFAFVLATFLWIVGQQVEVQSNVVGSVHANIENHEGQRVPGPAAAAGIKAGDIILAVDGRRVSTFTEVHGIIVRGSGRGKDGSPKVTLTIKRGNETFDADITPVYATREELRTIGILPVADVIVTKVVEGRPAAEAGIKPGDRIISIDGAAMQMPEAVTEAVTRSQGRPIVIAYERDGKPGVITVTPRLVEQPGAPAPVYQIGIAPDFVFPTTTAHIVPWTQVGNILRETWDNLVTLVNPRSDIGLDKMSGPVGIVHVFSKTIQRGTKAVIALMILINIALAVFNLLPIPVLDGGHILFATITKIKGSPLPMRFIMTTQSLFFALLIMLMVFVTFSDVRRVARDIFSTKPAPAPQQQAPAK